MTSGGGDGKPDRGAPGSRLLPVGECALAVEFGDTVDPQINARVLALDAALAAAAVPGVVELVPTYRSLLVHFDPLRTDLAAVSGRVKALLDGAGAADAGPARRWRVPVAYGGAHGIDLADLAARHGLGEDEVVALHARATYRVYMIGFAPGFAYLGGLDERLHTPRRTEPRMSTPAGTVSIGGAQTAVTSVAVPSGWHLIGRTPLVGFDPARDPPFLFAPGDLIVFEPIGDADWQALSGRIARGEHRAVPEQP